MQFMVIERFRNQDAKAIYRRLRERGRMMPEGLYFVSTGVPIPKFAHPCGIL
jgi:hypothetical protein